MGIMLLLQRIFGGLEIIKRLSSDSQVKSENWTGELFTGHLGIDTLLESGTETGLSYSITEADIEIEVDC